MDFGPAVERLLQVAENPDVDTSVHVTDGAISDLEEAGVVTAATGSKTRASISVNGDNVGLAEYIVFRSDGVGVLDTIIVEDEWQGKGIGTALSKGALNALSESADTAYILPLNDTSAHLAEKQGFEPCSEPVLDDWFVKHL